MAKQLKSKVIPEKTLKKQRRNLAIFLATLTLLKIVWLWGQPDHVLFGSDTENYFSGLEGLLKDGLFSTATNLHYWPSGYPILMWPFAELTSQYFAFMVGMIQILLFSYANYYFATQLQLTILNRLFWPATFIIALNPALALNAPAIGYEVNVASLFLITTGAFFKFKSRSEKSIWNREIWYAAVALSLATFMQPRISLLALVFFIIWAISSFRQPIALLMIVLTSMVVAIGPSMMIGRNFIANDFFAVSTNLGTTMNIGAGPDSTGGYTNKASGVPCPTIQGNPAAQDSHRVICVLEWYRNNPGEAVGLFVRKLQYHWSPWFGPLANGTTARSPWLDYHPFKSMIETQDGINFVYGNSGKLVSWAWLSGSMGFMIYGFIVLWRAKGLAQVFGMLLLAPSVFNALSSMLTIGDNRFRIPTMTLSVLLQLVGIYSIFAKRNLRMWTNRRVEPTWPGLKWKQNSEKDSLPNVDSGKA